MDNEHSLVDQVNVWAPYFGRGDSDNINIIIFLWIPGQPVVRPCLKKEGRRGKRKQGQTEGEQW